MIEEIKKLREKTGAGVMDVKKALAEAKGDVKKAEKIIQKKGLDKAKKKADKDVLNGLVYSYIHQTGRVGAMVEMACETDFVASNKEFKDLCKEMAMQVTSMNPKDVEELLKQDYFRDTSKKIEEVIKELIGKIGENMKVVKFVRFELGEK